jgi:hypothetical protein
VRTVTPDQLLAVLEGLSDPTHEGPDSRAELVAAVAEVCPECGEDYDEVGATARCRERHQLRLTPAGRELYYRGLWADIPARRSLTRAKRAGKVGDHEGAAALLGAIRRHGWEMARVSRLRVAACASCAAVVLVGYEADRIAGQVRADPWRLTTDGEVAAIVLGRPTWRVWGAWGAYRAAERLVGHGDVPRPSAADCVVVAAHVCGTRLDGEPIRAAVAHTRADDEIPF